jgi:hypothetical protein
MAHKRHVIFDPRGQTLREVLGWLDRYRYLGPVNPSSP